MNRLEFLRLTALMSVVGTLATPRKTLGLRNDRLIDKVSADDYISLIRRHFDRLIDVGLDVYGREKTNMWLASIDVRKGGQYLDITDANRRAYRLIHAPRGSTLYWDQAALATAYLLTDLVGEYRYGEFADKYIEELFTRCISEESGLFIWGNHQYYDVFTDRNATIRTPEHETRPYTPAWPMFWRLNPGITERAIHAMGRFHVYDLETGSFSRHAKTHATERPEGYGCSFISAGGVLVESLCWLAEKLDRDVELVENAHAVARFSFDTRSEETGLMRNQNGVRRWDYYECTTEIGLWARCLLRAAGYAGDHGDSFRDMAKRAVEAYLRYSFDEQAGKFYGALNVKDGTPVLDFDVWPDAYPAATPYRPRTYADIWEPLFPTHDYPMSMAEACIDLYNITGDDIFREGIQRWVEHIRNSLPASYSKYKGDHPYPLESAHRDETRIRGAYAGDYGLVIHFLARCAETLNEPALLGLAEEVASEAIDKLYVEDAGMFRSNPARYTCDAVDGIGTLFLALLKLETGRTGEDWGYYFV